MDLQKISLAFSVVTAIIVATLAFMFGSVVNTVKKESLPYCSVDIEILADFYAMDSILKGKVKNRKQVSFIIEKLSKLLENPYEYGCKAIFWKGAVVSKSVDITEKVRERLLQEE